MAGLAGWDFTIVDSEHGPIPESMYPAFVRAGEVRKLPVLVRVAENRPALIQQALDAGAAGVLVPQVGCYESAVAAVRAARFWPEGNRGVNAFVRAGGYSARVAADYLASANQETVCALQMESGAACEEAGKIAGIPGVDLLFVGPWDLSQSLGVPGQVEHPSVVSAIQRVIEACREHGIAAGIYAGTSEDAKRWQEQGMQLIACQVDTVVLLRGLRALRDTLR